MKKQHKKEIEYLKKNQDSIDSLAILSGIQEPRFTIKDVGVTHRDITYWDQERLLLNTYEAQKWRRFNLTEYVWIKIIIQLRKFRVPFKTLEKIRKLLLSKISYSELIKLEEVKDSIVKISEIEEDGVDEILNKDKVKKESENEFTSFLELSILNSLALNNNTSFLFNVEGKCKVFNYDYFNEVIKDKEFANFLSHSYISISLTEILADFISNKDLKIVYDELSLVTKNEMEVLKALREEDVKSVKVNFSNSKEIVMLEITKEEKIKNSTNLVDIILTKGYQDIELKTQNGKTVFCKNTRKIKLDNKMKSTE